MTKEPQIEKELIDRLSDLKYTYRSDIRDKGALEQNFREKFDALNRVNLTNSEFKKLREEIVNPDVFTASNYLRKRNSFTREDGEPNDIEKIVETYKARKEEERYARRVSMEEIKKNDFNLNISRYISTAEREKKIDLQAVNTELAEIEKRATDSAKKHNRFLKELGLKTI